MFGCEMFERVVCINLDRRPERWEEFQRGLPADWPFGEVERFPAVDGHAAAIPDWYGAPRATDNHPNHAMRQNLLGAWGCLQSHLAAWRSVMDAGQRSVLVLEDDAVFVEDFAAKAMRFIEHVPEDWDQLYFGGQHLNTGQFPPHALNDQVLCCRNVNRTHAYAIRMPMMLAAAAHLGKPWQGAIEKDWHVDHQLMYMHRSGDWCVYAPTRFIIGQRKSISDVRMVRRFSPTQFWNEFPIC